MTYPFEYDNYEITKDITRDQKRVAKIISFLEKYQLTPYHIHPDYTVDVFRSVYLENTGLKALPFKFGTVVGDFHASQNQFTNFKNFPNHIKAIVLTKEIIGTDNMYGFQPGDVYGGTLNLNNNPLGSLKGLNEIMIDKSIFLNNCKLTSLVGCPDKIHGSLFISSNPLTNLKGIASYIERHLKVFNCPVQSLEYFPSYIGEGNIVFSSPELNLPGFEEYIVETAGVKNLEKTASDMLKLWQHQHLNKTLSASPLKKGRKI